MVLESGTYKGFCWILVQNAGVSLPQIFGQAGFWFLSDDSLGHVSAWIISGALKCLQAIHSQNIIHCDIHPANVTICHTPLDIAVRIIDFGGAVEEGGTTDHINYDFASAYRCEPKNHPPTRADDIVSLAFMAIWMLKGTLPWNDLISDGSPTDLQQLIQCKQRPPESMTAGLDPAIQRFVAYALALPPSTPFDEIDYQSHIKALRRYSAREFTEARLRVWKPLRPGVTGK
ncbi:hypothetical protein EST38_g3590 [Candolleomyces aberdarensis]|uniref:Protein kinase domain-containing protein n=1 Tax=Candolleomyces aberdarensis TaxID=2316362 RepID=A0A4Q2DRX1_9AGAR|nr:hypothetical protein EST38_g3590 [Candolleomyces aberdarensis]